eukprot:CAMPEP_0119129370 /NCGR_PEP_ID=MMETSP1310-20130426/7149_1 /TAXON_ID=464262 /ORGANISM="Genus nov. species nov., Strain RCC2339" /LENGTH=310 /DNA_ID=CAMNT_0007119789 /DNA_START=203 /DNA_END=1135 /DNA_ORIENTATION=+
MADGEGDINQGFLMIKCDDKAVKLVKKELWVVQVGSSLHLYKSPVEAAPLQSLEIKGAEVAKLDAKKKAKKSSLEMTVGKSRFEIACAGEEDRENWFAALTEASGKEPAPPPSKEAVEKSKKLGRGARMKKAAGGKLASSGAGKAMTRRLADEETQLLLKNLKIVIAKDSNKKKADEIENDIMKIAVKSFFLVDNKVVNGNVFLDVDGPIRRAFELIEKVWDKKERLSEEACTNAFKTIEGHLRKAEKVLTEILLPHLKPHSIQRIKGIFNYLGSARFLQQIIMDDELEDEVHELVQAMVRYTQVHHYKD